MSEREEILYIEHTLRNIFKKDVIRIYDVTVANKLFEKWKLLTDYSPKFKYPIINNIIDDEPEWKKETLKRQNYENNQR